MTLRKSLALLAAFLGIFATQGSAQIFWSNHSPSGLADSIWCVTYANGTFAAVTNQGNLLTSPNGLNWSSQAIDQGVELISITYGDGKWVAVGDNGTILVSSDLTTWIHATSSATSELNSAYYNGSSWLAVGESATIIASADAKNWTTIPAPSGITGFLHGITGDGNGGFFVSGAKAGNGTGAVNFGVIVQCASGIASSIFDGGIQGTVNGGVNGNLEAILAGANPSIGITESGATLVSVGWGTVIQHKDFNPTGGQDSGFYSSSVPNVIYRGLAYGNGFYVAAGEQGTILSSPDGSIWTQRFSGESPSSLSTAALFSAAYSEKLQRFVVTGTGGTILVSDSAPTVFGNISTRGYVSSSQTFIGGFVVQGAAPRTVLIRADGPVLSTFSVPGPLADPVLTVYNSSGTVVASNTGWTTNANPSGISTAALEVGAFVLPNPGKDSALLLTLPPGAYTAQITSASGGSGTALFEAYTN